MSGQKKKLCIYHRQSQISTLASYFALDFKALSPSLFCVNESSFIAGRNSLISRNAHSHTIIRLVFDLSINATSTKRIN